MGGVDMRTLVMFGVDDKSSSGDGGARVEMAVKLMVEVAEWRRLDSLIDS